MKSNKRRFRKGGMGDSGSAATFIPPILFLFAVLTALWFAARPGTPNVPSVELREIQMLEGSLQLPDGKQFATGSRFPLASVREKMLSCADPARVRRIDDVEMRLRPCRFRFVDAGIRVEGGGLEVWVIKSGTAFETRTPAAVLGVLGTRFDVDVSSDKTTTVKVLEGKVKVTAVNGSATRALGPGEALRVTLAGEVGPVPFSPAPTAVASPTEITPKEPPRDSGPDRKPPEPTAPAPTSAPTGSSASNSTPLPDGSASSGAPADPVAGSSDSGTSTDPASWSPSPSPGSQDQPVEMDQLLKGN